jgi:CBS domain-containing protein
MSTVRDLLVKKGSGVLTTGRDSTVQDAAILMNEHKVGALVVLEAGRIAGMFTERDVLRRVVGQLRDPAHTTVAEVMTTEVVCCRPETSLEEARGSMMNRRIRHLPVVDDQENMVGLISIGDLNAHQRTSHEQTIYLLEEYVYGRV